MNVPSLWAGGRVALVLALGVFALALGAPAATRGAETGGAPTATVSGFQLAGGFDPNSGWKSWDIEGQQAEADATNTADIAITDLKLHMYSGGGLLTLDTTIQSPQAVVQPKTSTAGGPGFLYISGKSYYVTGSDWTWNGNTGNIDVRQNVHVTFASDATAPANATAPAQPITILSDSLEIEQKLPESFGKNKFVFSGNVVISDGNCTTNCGKLEVLAARDAMANPGPPPARGSAVAPPTAVVVDRGRIESIVASEKVVATQGNLTASGREAEMFPGDNRLILTGSPEVRDTASGVILQGSRITWQRNNPQQSGQPQTFDVEPYSITPGAPPRVRVTLPSLKHYQSDASAVATAPNPSERPMVITGETLHAQFGDQERRFDIERSVRISDPQLTVDAQHLDAEFSNTTAVLPALATATTDHAAAPTSEMGQLTHIAVSGDVVIYQEYRKTTADQAEISPSGNETEIVLNGAPKVDDTIPNTAATGTKTDNHRIITGNQIKIFTDITRAEVAGGPGHPAEIELPALPGLGDLEKTATKTDITSDSVTMRRDRADQAPASGEGNFTNFIFTDNVHIVANDLNVTCDLLEALALNAPPTPVVTPATAAATEPASDPLAGTGQGGKIVRLGASGHVVISQRDYQAKAARAEIYPQAAVADDSAEATNASTLHRSVELFGDAEGKLGPKRPTVVLPAQFLHDLVPDAPAPGAPATSAQPIEITSDQQKLLTSPTGDIYWFEGNVTADGGEDFRASCDEMKVMATPAGNTTGNNPPASSSSATVQQIIAAGNVKITQYTRVATADTAHITPATPGQQDGKVVLNGNADVVDTATGSHSENSDIELIQGDRSAHLIGAPVKPGMPPSRPTVTLPAIHFDNATQFNHKPASGTSK